MEYVRQFFLSNICAVEVDKLKPSIPHCAVREGKVGARTYEFEIRRKFSENETYELADFEFFEKNTNNYELRHTNSYFLLIFGEFWTNLDDFSSKMAQAVFICLRRSFLFMGVEWST